MKTNKKITIISSAIAVIFFIIALCCFNSGCIATAPLEGNTVISSSVSTTITTPKANTAVSMLASTETTLVTETLSNEISTTKKATTSTTILETTIPTTTITTTIPTTTTKIREETTTVPTTIKSNEDIALEVIRGNYGVMPERKVLLEKEGYVYENIQAIVNKMMDEINSKKNTTIVEQTTTIETTTSTVKTGEITNVSTNSTSNTSVSAETIQSTTTTESTIVSTNNIFTDYEYNLLCKLIANEYGGKSSVVERAKIVAAVVNQTTRYGDSIETCIYRSCVPWGFNPNKEYYGGTYYKDMSDAVDYYLNNGTAGFYDIGYWQEGADSWYGDGTWNHFYRA